jgi:hypothetical protein
MVNRNHLAIFSNYQFLPDFLDYFALFIWFILERDGRSTMFGVHTFLVNY